MGASKIHVELRSYHQDHPFLILASPQRPVIATTNAFRHDLTTVVAVEDNQAVIPHAPLLDADMLRNKKRFGILQYVCLVWSVILESNHKKYKMICLYVRLIMVPLICSPTTGHGLTCFFDVQ